MKHAHRFALFVLLAFAATLPVKAVAGPLATAKKKAKFTQGEVLVALEPDVRLVLDHDGRVLEKDGRISAALGRNGLGYGEELGPKRGAGAAASRRFFTLRSSRKDFDPVAAAADLATQPGVRAACPNYHLQLFSTLPNDTYVSRQWAVQHESDSDIQLPEAWDVEKGNASVLIGIMDTGVDLGHPDLVNKIWTNPDEILGNGLDDDGNGYVDDVQGWDFGGSDNDPNPHFVSDAIGLDVGFHGTFCAGLAAAQTNNDTGIAGASWNCKIVPLKIAHPDSGLVLSAASAAFAYAADKGVDVLSLSFGAPGDPGIPEYFQALVDLATDAGVLCVAAAGNDSTSDMHYPAAIDRVLAVAGTDSTNQRAWFSNYGSWVDCAAPSAWMWSTISRNYPFDFLTAYIFILALEWDGVNPYMRGDGTSFAAPLVAGVAGLMRAYAPGLTPEQIAQQIVNTGDVLPFDKPIGPKVNAYRALTELVVAADPAAARGLAIQSVAPNPIADDDGVVRFTLPSAGRVDLAVYDAAGRRVRELVSGERPAGPHAARWDGRGDGGARLLSGVYFLRLARGGEVVTRAAVLLR
jgi:subtilisin family serine protease